MRLIVKFEKCIVPVQRGLCFRRGHKLAYFKFDNKKLKINKCTKPLLHGNQILYKINLATHRDTHVVYLDHRILYHDVSRSIRQKLLVLIQYSIPLPLEDLEQRKGRC